MKKVQAIGRAAWACHLVNGDPSGLTDDEFAEMQAWLAYHGVLDDECVGARDDFHFGTPDMGAYRGVQGDLVSFDFLVDRASWRARVA